MHYSVVFASVSLLLSGLAVARPNPTATSVELPVETCGCFNVCTLGCAGKEDCNCPQYCDPAYACPEEKRQVSALVTATCSGGPTPSVEVVACNDCTNACRICGDSDGCTDNCDPQFACPAAAKREAQVSPLVTATCTAGPTPSVEVIPCVEGCTNECQICGDSDFCTKICDLRFSCNQEVKREAAPEPAPLAEPQYSALVTATCTAGPTPSVEVIPCVEGCTNTCEICGDSQFCPAICELKYSCNGAVKREAEPQVSPLVTATCTAGPTPSVEVIPCVEGCTNECEICGDSQFCTEVCDLRFSCPIQNKRDALPAPVAEPQVSPLVTATCTAGPTPSVQVVPCNACTNDCKICGDSSICTQDCDPQFACPAVAKRVPIPEPNPVAAAPLVTATCSAGPPPITKTAACSPCTNTCKICNGPGAICPQFCDPKFGCSAAAAIKERAPEPSKTVTFSTSTITTAPTDLVTATCSVSAAGGYPTTTTVVAPCDDCTNECFLCGGEVCPLFCDGTFACPTTTSSLKVVTATCSSGPLPTATGSCGCTNACVLCGGERCTKNCDPEFACEEEA